MKDRIELQGTDEDEIFKGLNNYFRKLAAKQIDQRPGNKLHIKKEEPAKKLIINIVRVLKELLMIQRL